MSAPHPPARGGPERLAHRYRRLLRAYPAAYRARRGDEIVGTYLELAEASGRTRPRSGDAVDLLAGGLTERLRARRAAGVADALPGAAVLALGAAVGLAGIWLVTVEPREVPPQVLLRTVGPAQTLGVVAWIGWVLAGVGAVALPGRTARRLILAATALTALLVPAALLTPYERPPLLVLVPQLALGLVALAWPAAPSRRARVAVAVLPAAAVGCAVAAGSMLYGYLATGPDVLAAVAVGLVGLGFGAAVARTWHGDARGWWALLLLLPPAALLVVRPVTAVVDAAAGWWGLAAVAAATFALAAVLLPVAVVLRGRN